MASAGVTTSQGSALPAPRSTSGPAGLGTMGPTKKGPAFVPISFQSLDDFVLNFGELTATSFASFAVDSWLSRSSGCTFIRLLGIGTGEKRLASDTLASTGENLPAGAVLNAGFVVGTRLTGSNGRLGSNPFAADGGLPGRTYFLGALMSESAGSTYFSDAGIQVSGENKAATILRGVLFAASGVLPALSGCYTSNASTASIGATVGSFSNKQDGGGTIGAVQLDSAAEQFVMLLNGHKPTTEYPNAITASFSFTATDDNGESLFFADRFNTDPSKLQQSGHYLYSYFDIPHTQAVVTGSGVVTAGTEKTTSTGQTLLDCGFLLTSSLPRNASNSDGFLTVPNFENFSDRFRTSSTPMVISQFLDRQQFDLFKFHALDDGNVGNTECKITIKNITPPKSDGDYGKFDVVIRSFENLDSAISALSGSESYTGCTLDPSSDNYIAKLIGDRHYHYNFDAAAGRQRFIKAGKHENNSAFVRVEVAPAIEQQTLDAKVLPAGFRGIGHLVTSGSGIMSNPQHPLSDGSVIASSTEWANNLIQPPIPYRIRISDDETTGDSRGERTLGANLCWGLQIDRFNTVKAPNKSAEQNKSVLSYLQYYPSFTTLRQNVFVSDNPGVADSAGTIYDSDKFNNDKFSLENILVHTRSDADLVDGTQWAYAKYSRSRVIEPLLDKTLVSRSGVRFLDFSKDVNTSNEAKTIDYLKFTFPLRGGFNGTDMFSAEKENFSNVAAYFEMAESAQGRKKGQVTAAYLKALEMLQDKSEVDIKLLAVPGIRIEAITNAALSVAEERFDTFYLMDIEEVDANLGTVVTSSNQTISPSLTAERFRSRAMNSTFAAAYFPDVEVQNKARGPATVFVPPSVAALRVYSRLNALGDVSAPAGSIRGVVDSTPSTVFRTKVQFDDTQKTTIDELFSVAINPIISGDTGLVLFGQRTMFTSQESMLQRISIRRMVIDIRRAVRQAAQFVIFEQNNEQVLADFQANLNPILARFVRAGGISKYKVVVDETTTTQADIEANVVRGKVFLQPTRSEEIVQVDFVT